MNRIDLKFKELKNKSQAALIAFITAGFPDLVTTEKLVKQLAQSGVDLIELGVPFSDPLADGLIIQEASAHALKGGVNLIKIIALVKKIRSEVSLPICLMSYYNPIFCLGDKNFIDQALAAGVDGVIIPDLPSEEALEFNKYANKKGLVNICFLAPTSTPERIKKIAKIARGFIYYVSLAGVTGKRNSLAKDLKIKLSKIKQLTTKPVCVGFGISTPQQARVVAKISDGVIIGSAIVEKIKENLKTKDLVQRVGKFVERFNV